MRAGVIIVLVVLLLGCVAPEDQARAAQACEAYLRERVIPGQEVSFGTARSMSNQDGTLTLEARFTASIRDPRIKDARARDQRGSYSCAVRPLGDERWQVVSLRSTPLGIP